MNAKKLALACILAFVVVGCVLSAGCTSTPNLSSSVNEKVVNLEMDIDNVNADYIDVYLAVNETDKTITSYVNLKNDIKDDDEFDRWGKVMLALLFSSSESEEDVYTRLKIMFGDDFKFKDEKGNILSKEDFNYSNYTVNKLVCKGLVNGVEKTKTYTMEDLNLENIS